MKHVFGLAVLIAAAVPAVAQEKKPAPPPAGSAEMRVAVELIGRLKVTENGAEWTFVGADCAASPAELTPSGPRIWKVDLSRSPKLRQKAAALDGKEVIIEGTAKAWLAEYSVPVPPLPPVQPVSPYLPPPPLQQPQAWMPPHEGPPTLSVPPPLPPMQKSYRLQTESVVKATSLRAKKQ